MYGGFNMGMFNLGMHGSHNANFALSYEGKVLEVLEIERMTNTKNQGLWFYFAIKNQNTLETLLREVHTYFSNKYQIKMYDHIVYNSVPWEGLELIKKIFPANKYDQIGHHQAHAFSALYQSPYDEAMIISLDGGSDEKFFNVYYANKKADQILKKIYVGAKDYAVPYMTPAHFIEEIKQENIGTGNLVYAGKLMGLAGYGNINNNFIEPLREFYMTAYEDDISLSVKRFIGYFSRFGVVDESFRFSGQLGRDLAATNQYIFEELFFRETAILFSSYSEDLPIIMTGGAALNIINNTRLSKQRKVFVPPNPNDCGLGVGCVASIIKPSNPVDCTYIGPEAWDRNELFKIAGERRAKKLELGVLAEDIINGKIIGVVRGRSEHGPRALGNRSIICNPTIDNMKDILNAKVKGREYYRPFAPVVRLDDAKKYFDLEGESKWMTFCPKVKEEYKDKLKAITHIDGTARVQTVTQEQNKFLYDLLSLMSIKNGIGILLNTSFNIAGKPILNTYKDALWVLDNKQMDGLILEDFYIKK